MTLAVLVCALGAAPVAGPDVTFGDSVAAPWDAVQAASSAATNGTGFLVGWSDWRTVNGPWVARIDSSGVPLDPLGIALEPYGGSPTLAYGARSVGGAYVAAWPNDQAKYCQVFTDGRVGPTQQTLIHNVNSTAVASDSDGFLLTFSGDGRVYSTRVSPTGTQLDEPPVTLYAQGNLATSSQTPCFGTSSYLVPLTEQVAGHNRVVAVRVNQSTGALLDPTPFVIASDAPDDDGFPATAWQGDHWLVSWVRTGTGATRVGWAFVDEPTGAVTGQANIDADTFFEYFSASPLAVVTDGSRALIAYSSSSFIGAIDAEPTGGVPGPTYALATTGGRSNRPSMAWAADSGVGLLFWDSEELGLDQNDLHAAMFDFGSVQALSPFMGIESQTGPVLATNGQGYVVAWVDYHAVTGHDIEAAVIGPGAQVGPQLAVDEEQGEQLSVAVSVIGSTYLVAWLDHSHLYGRRLSSSGALLDAARVRLDDVSSMDAPSHYSGHRVFALASDGSQWFVAWVDGSLGTVRGRRFDPGLQPLDTPSLVLRSTASAGEVAACTAPDGFLVVWSENASLWENRVSPGGVVFDGAGHPLVTLGRESQPACGFDGLDDRVVFVDSRVGDGQLWVTRVRNGLDVDDGGVPLITDAGSGADLMLARAPGDAGLLLTWDNGTQSFAAWLRGPQVSPLFALGPPGVALGPHPFGAQAADGALTAREIFVADAGARRVALERLALGAPGAACSTDYECADGLCSSRVCGTPSTPDGGPFETPDSGTFETPDGGRPGRTLRVQCGCVSGGSDLLFAVAVALIACRRRPRRR